MKRYKQANEEIRVPDKLRGRVLTGTQRTAPRRAVVLATAAVLLITATTVGVALTRRGDSDAPISPVETTVAPGTTDAPSTTTPTETAIIEGMLPLQLTEVAYPEMAQYPLAYLAADGELLDGFSEAYAAWSADKRARQNQPEGYDAGLAEASTALMRQFLTSTDETAGQNRVLSPLNLYLALAMLTETTDTTSRAALLDLLGADSVDTLRERVAAIWTANYVDDGESTTRLAASLWLADGLSYRTDTLNRLAKYHYAASFQGKMGSDALNTALRDWLNTNTGGLLKEKVNSLAFDADTVLGLATTIYYQAKWDSEFREANTADRVFHAASGDVTVPFMNQTQSGYYCWGDGFGAIRRGLSNGNMWLILPDEGVTPDDLIARGDIFTLTQQTKITVWADSKYLRINLAMPKFDVAADLDLNAGLTELGLGSLFDPATADFSPITDDAALADELYLSQVKHAARVKVDEEGCEAAAYTMIMVTATGGPPPEVVDFVLDRPFIFVITSDTGATLFAGVVETLG